MTQGRACVAIPDHHFSNNSAWAVQILFSMLKPIANVGLAA
jgi:hypothetical protein